MGKEDIGNKDVATATKMANPAVSQEIVVLSISADGPILKGPVDFRGMSRVASRLAQIQNRATL